MTKNPEEELVTKGAVKEALKKAHRFYPLNYTTVKSIIDKLPAVSIKSPEQIEKAIEYFENISDDDLITYFGSRYSTKHIANMFADFVRCILNQPSTWDEKKIFGKS